MVQLNDWQITMIDVPMLQLVYEIECGAHGIIESLRTVTVIEQVAFY